MEKYDGGFFKAYKKDDKSLLFRSGRHGEMKIIEIQCQTDVKDLAIGLGVLPPLRPKAVVDLFNKKAAKYIFKMVSKSNGKEDLEESLDLGKIMEAAGYELHDVAKHGATMNIKEMADRHGFGSDKLFDMLDKAVESIKSGKSSDEATAEVFDAIVAKDMESHPDKAEEIKESAERVKAENLAKSE
jgi:hypothetical protein